MSFVYRYVAYIPLEKGTNLNTGNSKFHLSKLSVKFGCEVLEKIKI